MCKNGEHNVVDFVCAKGRQVDIYAGSRRHSCHLTNMCWKLRPASVYAWLWCLSCINVMPLYRALLYTMNGRTMHKAPTRAEEEVGIVRRESR
jgi:hypothetical protein